MYGGYPFQQYFGPQGSQMMPQGIQPMQMPSMGQPPIQNPQNGPQGPSQVMEVVSVQTIQQVEQIGLQPGQRKMVMVQNDAVVALRVADPVSGLVDTKYYTLTEFDPNAAQPQTASVNYITSEQLEERLAAFADSLKPGNRMRRDAKEGTE